jgi:hypothetical protein
MDQQGELAEKSPEELIPPPPIGQQTERWVEAVRSAPAIKPAPSVLSTEVPPSFESLHTPTDDGGAKEMVIREDNMKFPPSMKWERPKPESRREGISQLEIPSLERTASNGSQRRQPSPQLLMSDDKEPYYLNTDVEDEDSETDNSSKKAMTLSGGEIIKTSELIALSQALTIRPAGSENSFYSGSSYIDEDVPRSMAYRPKRLEGTSPQPGAIMIPTPGGKSGDRLGSGSLPDTLHLAPDEKGNEIPPDAKWTKINRRLVSPEVLNQDGRRYEA